jgi:uroporphyrinogen III methyltransferase/synthase
LREKLRWFDDITIRPLFGKRILVTRAREQASALSDALLALGAEPVEFPTIRIVPRAEAPALLAAIQHIGAYRWLVFTSTNSVDQFGIWLTRAGKDSRALAGLKVAAIGPATAHQVTIKLGIVADYIPAEAVAEAVLSGWPDPEMSGTSVLIPRAAEAREVLPEGLRNLGARVDVIPVYDTVLDTSSADALLDELKNGQLTALTFTSSSTVTNFLEAIGSPDEATLKSLLSDVDVFVIGPITARTLRDAGIEPNVSAEKHTIPGLIEAISGYYASKASDLSHA